MSLREGQLPASLASFGVCSYPVGSCRSCNRIAQGGDCNASYPRLSIASRANQARLGFSDLTANGAPRWWEDPKVGLGRRVLDCEAVPIFCSVWCKLKSRSATHSASWWAEVAGRHSVQFHSGQSSTGISRRPVGTSRWWIELSFSVIEHSEQFRRPM
jgi:hypothetical protein